jgi:dTDP-4-amino-4,6-dideoxygalactose transaminase
MEQTILFNKPYFTGKETAYVHEAFEAGKIGGDGRFNSLCTNFFEKRYGFKKTFLTNSCTAALEISALLIDTQPGDEIIMPSYTFVSTANAFVMRGAKIVFADVEKERPNIDACAIESLITPNTKAIVCVHYAGMACDMDALVALCEKHNVYLIEDAAQAIDAYYKNKPLGSFGDFATFSFHETKNITCGEGGMLVINNAEFIARAEILREKGTNRGQFVRGLSESYGWVDIGSSYLPGEITAAVLWAQLEQLDRIQAQRKKSWEYYYSLLEPLQSMGYCRVPELPSYASNNAHIFYLVCRNGAERNALIESLKEKHVQAVFHYLPLHASEYYRNKHDGRALQNTDRFATCLVRLPLFFELTKDGAGDVCHALTNYFNQTRTRQ